MNFKDLLNTDHKAIAQAFLHAFRWWVDELMGMVPPQWRDRFLRRSSVSAELTDDGLIYRDQSGQLLAQKPRGSVNVLLPPSQVLLRQVELPILPASDLRRMIALEMDRFTPFRPEQVLFDTEVLSRDDERGRQQVLMGVMPRGAVESLVQRVRANDVEPAALSVAPVSDRGSKLNFLPAWREAEGGGGARRRATYFWIAAGVLLLFNLFMLNYRDSTATAQLREAVESQQGPVTVAMRLRDSVQKEATRRAGLLKQQQQGAPLPILEAVTEAVPDTAWVERFEWNGRTVHIRGFRKESSDMLAKLEASPFLRNARSQSSDPHAAVNGSGSFDLAADREAERAR